MTVPERFASQNVDQCDWLSGRVSVGNRNHISFIVSNKILNCVPVQYKQKMRTRQCSFVVNSLKPATVTKVVGLMNSATILWNLKQLGLYLSGASESLRITALKVSTFFYQWPKPCSIVVAVDGLRLNWIFRFYLIPASFEQVFYTVAHLSNDYGFVSPNQNFLSTPDRL